MELYMCGFNAHDQLIHGVNYSNFDILQFERILRSPRINIKCALWSSTVIDVDGSLVHHGFCSSGQKPVIIGTPPPRNIKTVFGDTSGVLGVLTTNGNLYLLEDSVAGSSGLELKKYHFKEDDFIEQEKLRIEHLTIAENGEVCICTTPIFPKDSSNGFSTPSLEETPRLQLSLPTVTRMIHTFASFKDFITSKPPTSSNPVASSLVSLLGSATCFTALTVTREVLTFGSTLHPQCLGRITSPSMPAEAPSTVPFLGGIPIRKVAVGGWLSAAVSEDYDLYIWGGQAGEGKRLKALPRFMDGEEVKLVDIKDGIDVVDVGVGSDHIIALTGDGEAWVTGEGKYGQLGTGKTSFEEDWVQVTGEWGDRGEVVGVGCGIWCSWILVEIQKSGE